MTIAIILVCLAAIAFYCTRAPHRVTVENGTRITLTAGETVPSIKSAGILGTLTMAAVGL